MQSEKVVTNTVQTIDPQIISEIYYYGTVYSNTAFNLILGIALGFICAKGMFDSWK